ncbi:MAG: c-type cytochrome [Acidobacteriota bacterium]
MARAIALTLILFCGVSSAMDPARGKQVLRDQNCLSCHNVRGEGGTKAPDLSARLVDHYTPAALASLLWNHLPEMWSTMPKNAAIPQPSPRDAEDLFGYLYTAHFANPPGNEMRGRTRLRTTRMRRLPHQGARHANGELEGNSRSLRVGPADVESLLVDARSRYNKGVMFERLSSRDLADITSYATRGLARDTAPQTLPESTLGEALFKSNCGGCHPAIVDLRKRMRDRTPLEVASALWNHATNMQTVPLAAPSDMRNIVGYVWNLQFTPQGDPAAGAKTFADKGCSGCHQQMARGERVYTAYSMISLWWQHGPLMKQDAQGKNRARWQDLSADDVDNLVAYMNRRQ